MHPAATAAAATSKRTSLTRKTAPVTASAKAATPAMVARWAARNGVVGVSIEHFLLSERLVGALRANGLSVNTGTVNDAEVLERVLAFGPDAVVSDRPHELRAEAALHAAVL